MTGSLVLLRPGWLAVCLTLIAAHAIVMRSRRRHAAQTDAPVSFVRAVGAIVLCVLGVALLSGWLVYVHSAGSQFLLLAGGILIAAWATVESYRRVLSLESATAGVLLIGVRLAVWTLLLILIGRPVWDWVAVDWRKPQISVVLDDSLSMSIDDSAAISRVVQRPTTSQAADAATSRPTSSAATATSTPAVARGPSRAEIVNVQTRRLSRTIAQLAKYYDLRVSGLEAAASYSLDESRTNWRVEPSLSRTSLAAAIGRGANLGARDARRPRGVLVISDGAENVESERALRQIAARLAERGVALWTVGAGPRASEMRRVEMQPLNLPSQIGVHDRLTVQVRARLRGYSGARAAVELSWAEEAADSSVVRSDRQVFDLEHDFEVVPPAPGLQRLTARISLGPEYGNESFETHALIEVTQGSTRVLMLEAAPRTETAFVTRALLGDGRFELTRKFLPRKPGGVESEGTIPPETWDDYDVILFGSVPRWRLTTRSMLALVEAVDTRGVGLLLAGGRQLFNDGRFADTPLAEVSPAEFVRTDQVGGWRPRFVPTELGLRHPLLRLPRSATVDAKWWRGLPALTGAADLGALKPLAAVLADDGAGRPMLATLDYGKGRCVAAAWESTWGWALASDEGPPAYRTFWRQLVAWLANRRPRAWVMPDRVVYPIAVVRSGQQRVRIRAGVTGLEDVLTVADDAAASRPSAVGARPKLRAVGPAGDEQSIRLEREGGAWVGEMQPGAAGDYELHFEAALSDGEKLEASSRFSVAHFDIELKSPTANLALLREAAEATAERGGRFVRIEALGELLSDLARDDRRTRIERPMLFDPVDRNRWAWLTLTVLMLALEWAIRKRAALV